MTVKFPHIKIRYARWSDVETLRQQTEKELKKSGATFDEIMQFRKDCRQLTNSLTFADSLVDNVLKYWVTVEKTSEKRKNWK